MWRRDRHLIHRVRLATKTGHFSQDVRTFSSWLWTQFSCSVLCIQTDIYDEASGRFQSCSWKQNQTFVVRCIPDVSVAANLEVFCTRCLENLDVVDEM